MKLSPAQQAALDRITVLAQKAGNVGSGNIDNPKTASDKRWRKLFDAGLICHVGCGQVLPNGCYSDGVGLIPASMFDSKIHTKLSLDWCRTRSET